MSVISGIVNGRPYTENEGHVDKELLSDYEEEYRELVLAWIKENIKPARQAHKKSSYGLKHYLTKDTGLYLTNNAFKDAMLIAGYFPVDASELNWHYRIKFDRKDFAF